jgi:hypothetical protein
MVSLLGAWEHAVAARHNTTVAAKVYLTVG